GIGAARDDVASRAHAEGVDADFFRVPIALELVLRGIDLGQPAGLAVLPAVDVFLGMLDAQSDGEGLRLEADSLPLQRPEKPSRAVAAGEDQAAARDPASAPQKNALHLPAGEIEGLHPSIEAEFR